jgi:hypothetical protein
VTAIFELLFIGAFRSIASKELAMANTASINGLGASSGNPIVSLVVSIVFGFLFAAIFAWLYNFLVPRVGGIKIDISKNTLNNVGPMSFAKMYTTLAVILLIIELILFAGLAGIVGGSPLFSALRFFGGSFGSALGGIFAVALVIGLLVAIVLIFLLGLLFTWIYNQLAKKFGGLAIDLKKV